MSEYIYQSHGEPLVNELGEIYLARAGEIVRCRDCKNCDEFKVRYSDVPLFECTADWCEGSEGDHPLVEPYGFCAWGERK